MPDADPKAEGFLSASSLRLDPMKPLSWHLDGEHVPWRLLRVYVLVYDGGLASAVIRGYRLELDRQCDCHERDLSVNVGGLHRFVDLPDFCPEQ